MGKSHEQSEGKNSPWDIMANSLKSLGLLTLAVPGGWILYSNLAIQHEMILPDAIPAERAYFSSEQGGILNYYFDRTATGRPLVLIHSVNAAASAYELRPLFEHFRTSRPVFALDLPGYGFSDRANKVYSPQVFQYAILDLINTQVKEPCDVIA
ncbi:MAG: hypothetical protein HY326_12500, partial [Chloroflexi bacterium]|nr:hypothetical protein [Chloroflexota bacterium]